MRRRPHKFARSAHRTGAGMNKTESAYAERLETLRLAGEIEGWVEHGVTLRLGANSRYEPDFLVLAADGVLELHEVKGSAGWRLDPESRTKFKIAAERFPFFRFVSAIQRRKKDGGGWAVEVYVPRAPWPPAGGGGAA